MTIKEGRTDVNNARRLAEMYGDRIRWVPEWKNWAAWDDNRWVADDKDVFAIRYAKRVASDVFRELAEDYQNGEDPVRKAVASFAVYSSSARGIREMISLARDQMLSYSREFESEPMLLNVGNGTVELETGKLRPRDPEERLLNMTDVVYDQKRRCPTWERFVSQIFGKKSDLIEYARRLVGYVLTGDVSEQMLLFCYGSGGNGKGTFYTTVSRMLGDYAGKAPRNFLLWKNFDSHPTDLVDLYSRRLVVCSETGEGRALDETFVKELTGGDPIRARKLYQNNWEFWPTHKLWLVSNHKPRVIGSDRGIWRRIKVLPFEQEFSPTDDPGLERKLMEELPGILAWAVRGCIEWQRDGLKSPVSVEEETATYRYDQDVVGRFIAEHCDIDPSSKEGSTVLYEKFNKEYPEAEMSQSSFGSRLASKGFKNKTADGKEVRTTDGKKGWKGLKLREAV